MRSVLDSLCASGIAWFVCLTAPATLVAQPPASIVPLAPQSPTIQVPQPLGARPGQTVEVVLTGTNLIEPIAVLGLPAKFSFPTDGNNGKDPGKLRVRLEIPTDARVGAYPLRLATRFGLSNARTFCIDDLPTGPTAGPEHRSKQSPAEMPVPSVASGRIDPETSQFFKIKVSPSQRVCIEVLARRLGSALDPIIILHDAKTGREIPSLYSDDAPGCQTDARLTHVFSEAAEILIEVRDSTFRGGPDSWYRLRVGDFPLAITPLPLAAQRGGTAMIGFAGLYLAEATPVTVPMPGDPAVGGVVVVPRGKSGQAGWPVTLVASDWPELIEQEPNDEPAKALRVPVPCGVSGRFDHRSDHDAYSIQLKKGERVLIQSITHELLSPADAYFVLKNAKGQQLAANDPASGKGIDFTAPEDGEYAIIVEHLNFLHGPNEVYRLTISRPEPDFSLTLAADRIEIPSGGSAVLPIQTLARQGVTQPIEVKVVGLSGVTGSVTIDAQANLAPNLPIALLPITHVGGPLQGSVRIEARAKGGNREIVRFADITPQVKQRLGNLPFPPREQLTTLDVATVETPFRIAAKYAFPEAARGTPINVTVSAQRDQGFAEEIALSVVGLPPNVTAAAKPIPKGANEVVFPITAAENAPAGVYPIVIVGKGKKDNRDFQVAIAAALRVAPAPFDLSLVESPPPLKPGDKIKVKAKVTRKGGFAGTIDLQFKNLPAGVMASNTTVPANANEIDIELSVNQDAAPAEKADVALEGKSGAQSATFQGIKVVVKKKE